MVGVFLPGKLSTQLMKARVIVLLAVKMGGYELAVILSPRGHWSTLEILMVTDGGITGIVGRGQDAVKHLIHTGQPLGKRMLRLSGLKCQ